MGKERFSKANVTPLKLTIIGGAGVGKTSLLLSYKNSKFESNDGKDFEPVTTDYLKVFTMEEIEIPVIIGDSTSQKEYKYLRPLAYKDTDCFIMCYAINNATTFADIERDWIPSLRKICRKVPYILVGTKVDTRKSETEAHRLISNVEGERQKDLIKAEAYLEISSKEMLGLDVVFSVAVRIALNNKYGNRRGSCVLS